MSAVIWGMYNDNGDLSDWKGGQSGQGYPFGSSGQVWAYCERLSFGAQATVKEVSSGDGRIRFRHNFGVKYRIDGVFVPIDFNVVVQLFDLLVKDDAVKMTDTDMGDLWVFLDSDVREKIAGQSLPEAARLHITGWAYPYLVTLGTQAPNENDYDPQPQE